MEVLNSTLHGQREIVAKFGRIVTKVYSKKFLKFSSKQIGKQLQNSGKFRAKCILCTLKYFWPIFATFLGRDPAGGVLLQLDALSGIVVRSMMGSRQF